MPIIHDDDFDGQLVHHDGGKLGNGHLEAAIADEREHQLVRPRHLRADGGGQAETHGPETARGDPEPRLVEADQLRGPHLVLTHVGGDNGMPRGQAVDFAHEVLGLDFGIGNLRRQGVLGFPLADLMPPGAPRRGELFVHGTGFGKRLVQLAKDALHVAHDGHVGGAVLADLGGVDIDVNHLGVGGESGQASGDAIVEADAEGDQQIAAGERHVGGVAAVHAGHADEIGMVGREGAEAHEGLHHGRVGQLDELAEFPVRACRDHAAAGVHQRPRGFLHQLGGALDLPGVALGEDFVAGQVDGSHGLVMPLSLEHVLGDIDQDRPGTAGGGHVEGLMHDAREVREVLDQVIVLGGGARDAEGVGLLKRVAADELGGDLPGDGDDGDGIHERVHQAGGQVGGARPGSGAADAYFTGGARVAFGGEGRIFLVTHQDVLDGAIVEHVVEGKRDPARVAEHAIHAFPRQTLDEHSCAAH